MALMADVPELNKRESRVCMPMGFPADLEPPLQSVAGLERSMYGAAWHEAMELEPRRSQQYGNVPSRDTVKGVKTCTGVLLQINQDGLILEL